MDLVDMSYVMKFIEENYKIVFEEKLKNLNTSNYFKLLHELNRAIGLTEAAFTRAKTPAVKDMHRSAIAYYNREIERIEELVHNHELPNEDGTYNNQKPITEATQWIETNW